MNIIELTRILNERYKYMDVTNEIGANVKKLDNTSQVTKDSEKVNDVNDFLNKVNNLLLKKIDSLDENSGYSQLLKRLEGFYGGSNANNDSVLNEILSLLTPDLIDEINQITPDQLFQNQTLGGLFSNFSLGNKKDDYRDRNKIIKNFMSRLSAFRPGSCGPFEVLLCLLFKGTKVQVANKVKGDIVIGGKVYEVKRDGGGCIDTGLDQIELMMKKAQGNELKQLTQRFEQAKKLFNVLDSKGSSLMEEYAKKLNKRNRNNAQRMEQNFTNAMAQNQNLDTQDVENYFSLLSDDDKKRAVLYGFFMLGYQNIIICKKDTACSYKVITSDKIRQILRHEINMESLGFTIKLSSDADLDDNETKAKSANFGSFIIKLV